MQGGPSPWPTEIVLNPGVGIAHQLLNGADFNMFVDKDSNAVGDGVKAVEIVGNHDHGQAQPTTEIADQLIEAAGADRVEASGGFIEEEKLRIQRQGAGKARPFAHAAGKL